MALPVEPANPSRKFDLGVLFVHGLGTQSRGSTLVQWTSELHRCLSKWLAGGAGKSSNDRVQVTDACLGVRSDIPDDDSGKQHPPWTTWVVKPGSGMEAQPSTWLLAESWWAESFLEPSYTELVQWSVQTVPWTLASHFGTRLRRARERLKHANGKREITSAALLLGRELFYFAVAIALFPLLILVLLVLIAAALIPKIRAFAVWLQRGLARTLGDSLILLQSPIQRAAIIGRVRRDAEWLAARCSRVAIVAHSQGAAIALKCMHEPMPDNTVLLVTYGSGISKLLELEKLPALEDRVAPWLGLWGFLLIGFGFRDALSSVIAADWPRIAWLFAGLVLAAVLMLFGSSKDAAGRSGRRWWSFVSVMSFLAALAALVYIGKLLGDHMQGPGTLCNLGFVFVVISLALSWTAKVDVDDLDRPSRTIHPLWLDVYASSDPVPNGPIVADTTIIDEATDFATCPATNFRPLTFRVMNRKSILSDHTTYWNNHDQFGVFVSRALLHAAGLQPQGSAGVVLRAAGARREWRLKWLTFTRVYLLGCFALLVAALYEQWAFLPPEAVTFKYAAGTFTRWITDSIGWIASHASPALKTRAAEISWILDVAILMLGCYAVALLAWKLWDRVEMNAFLERKPIPLMGTWFVAFIALHAAFIEIPLMYSLGWTAQIGPSLVWAASLTAVYTGFWRFAEVVCHPQSRSSWPETRAFGSNFDAFMDDKLSSSELKQSFFRTLAENLHPFAAKYLLVLLILAPDCFRIASHAGGGAWKQMENHVPPLGTAAVCGVVVFVSFIDWSSRGQRFRQWLENWSHAGNVPTAGPAQPLYRTASSVMSSD